MSFGPELLHGYHPARCPASLPTGDRCARPYRHDGEHVCGCGNRWTGEEAGRFVDESQPSVKEPNTLTTFDDRADLIEVFADRFADELGEQQAPSNVHDCAVASIAALRTAVTRLRRTVAAIDLAEDC